MAKIASGTVARLSFRAVLPACPLSPEAPEGYGPARVRLSLGPLCRPPQPLAAWGRPWEDGQRGGVSVSRFWLPAASDLGPLRTSPVGIWSVCLSLGLSVDGVPPSSRVVGFSLVGFRDCSPGQEGVPATLYGHSELRSHHRGVPQVCSPSSVRRCP